MLHLDIKVSGLVQGVYFRVSTRETANLLNIKGWVKNQSDGSVRIEAEGDDDAMQAFCDWLQYGPDGAVVENVQISAGSVQNYAAFIIK